MEKDYNKELRKILKSKENLIREATSNGWILNENELIFDEKIPVIEVYTRYESACEEYGKFHIFKTTVPIKLEDYENIMSFDIKNKQAVWDYIWEMIGYRMNGYKYKKLEEFNKYEYSYDGCTITKNKYRNDMTQEVFEMYFSIDEEGYGYAEGYLNVFKMPKDDLIKQDDINLCLRKYMHDN